MSVEINHMEILQLYLHWAVRRPPSDPHWDDFRAFTTTQWSGGHSVHGLKKKFSSTSRNALNWMEVIIKCIKICGMKLQHCWKGDLYDRGLALSKRESIKSISSHLRRLEGEEQNKLKASRRKGVLKISLVIDEIEKQENKREKNIKETKIWFFEKTHNSYKPLARLTK